MASSTINTAVKPQVSKQATPAPQPAVAKAAAPATAPAAAANSKASATGQSAVVSLGQQKKNDLGLYNSVGAIGVPPGIVTPSAVPPAKPAFTADGGDVVVDIKASDSGYNNRIFYSTDNFKTKTYIGIDNQVGSVNLGSFKAGTKIEFGIDNGVGNTFTTGGAAANADKFDHTQVTQATGGGVRIGFEDLYGGGDRDFNDAIIEVRNVAKNDNRSGLGDGTNPGKGTGTANSPNQGTNNPGGSGNNVAAPVPPKAPAPVAAPVAPAAVKTATSLTTAAALLAATQAANTQAANSATKPATTPAAAAKPAPAPAKLAPAPIQVKPPVVAPAPAKTTAAATVSTAKPVDAKSTAQSVNTQTNRSGLADGTNPGQGSGTVNSPNIGTLNPNNVGTVKPSTAVSATKPGVKV